MTNDRKRFPVATGVLDYFPDAILAVAEVSRIGNDQHNLGQKLHWDRSKSMDQADALMRHLLERGTLDSDGIRHTAKVAWRALALLQIELEDTKSQEAASRESSRSPAVPGSQYEAFLRKQEHQRRTGGSEVPPKDPAPLPTSRGDAP